MFAGSGFASQPRADISRWKYAKFLRNVTNAVDALFDRGEAPEVARGAPSPRPSPRSTPPGSPTSKTRSTTSATGA